MFDQKDLDSIKDVLATSHGIKVKEMDVVTSEVWLRGLTSDDVVIQVMVQTTRQVGTHKEVLNAQIADELSTEYKMARRN
jgi:uncharacterized Fe-S cluster-containing radical SAM superfamily enzyme